MSNEFLVQKGFLEEFSVFKGDGHAEDTLPADPGRDVTDSAGVDSAGVDRSGANIKPGENKPGGPGTTMADDLSEVAGEAKKDIEATYVSDAQNLGGEKNEIEKGWESYNQMVEKGFVVDQNSFSRYDIDGSFDTIEKSVADHLALRESDSKWMVAKEVDDSLLVEKMKNPVKEDLTRRTFSMEGGDVKVTPGETPVGRKTREAKEGIVSAYQKARGYVEPKVRAAASKVAEGGKAVGRYAAAHPYRTGAAGLGAAGLIGGGVYALSRRKEKGFADFVEKAAAGDIYGTKSREISDAQAAAPKKSEWLRGRESGRIPAYKTRRALSKQFGKITPTATEAAIQWIKDNPKKSLAIAAVPALGAGGYGVYRATRKEKGADEEDFVFKCSSVVRVPKGKVKK
jgi:hypothetical protein